jgi:arylsulfatase A-like enzyme
MISKLQFIAIIIGIQLIVLAPLFLHEHLAKKGPLNLVIISIDTLRPDHMGIYGYNRNTTPNIDKWAKDAFVFTNASTIIPLTLPSFASLMTGLEPLNTGVFTNADEINNQKIEKNTKTLVKILKENGYYSSSFITSGVLDQEISNINEGFDEYYQTNYWYFVKNGTGYYETSRDKYESFINKAVSWIDKNKNKKFFLWIHLQDPHYPYDPPDSLICKFNKDYCEKLKNLTTQNPESMWKKQYNSCQTESVPRETIELVKDLYDGDIAASDILAGKIFRKLETAGLDRNTIVVLYGDHGESFAHNYYFNHGGIVNNSTISIPLIIKYPKNLTFKKSDILINNTDILPTLNNLLGIPSENLETDGISFDYVFNSHPILEILAEKRKFTYAINDEKTKFSIYDGKYKYIYSDKSACLNNNQTEELYDLANDKGETNNIIYNNKLISDNLKHILFKIRSDPRLKQDVTNITNKTKLDRLKSLGY